MAKQISKKVSWMALWVTDRNRFSKYVTKKPIATPIRTE
jgi:hypothetical protein